LAPGVPFPIGHRLARAAYIALLALAFVVAGTGGRHWAGPPAVTQARHAPRAPLEAAADLPQLGALAPAQVGEASARVRSSAGRKAVAARKAPRGSSAEHQAALNGAAFALAAAARDRERPAACDRPASLPPTRLAARGPPPRA
jgi:hypothetical protein